jgi:hypothetical protein
MNVFLVLSVALSILISSPISHWVMAQMQNTTLPENTNNTRMVLNLKDKTVTLINATTNETISVKSVTEARKNMTANETLSGTAANMTANETLSGTAANMTANANLTEKFRELGK